MKCALECNLNHFAMRTILFIALVVVAVTAHFVRQPIWLDDLEEFVDSRLHHVGQEMYNHITPRVTYHDLGDKWVFREKIKSAHPDSILVQLDGNKLTIGVETTSNEKGRHSNIESVDVWSHTLTLPTTEKIDQESISAKLDGRVLEVIVKKPELIAKPPIKINVKVGEEE